MSAEFYICNTDAQNFIFRAAESAFKFKFLVRTGQTARILGALNFRLPRRINFRSPAQLNLKRALAIKFKACFLELDRAPQNFKIYRAVLVYRVNLDTAFARLKFKIARCGVNLIRSERYSVILVGSPNSLFISEIKISLPSCAPFASSARPAFAARTLLLVSRGFAA